MSTSLSSLFRRNPLRVSFGLLALLLVSALFLLVTPPTSADSPVEGKGDADSPLYATAKRAAVAEAIAAVDSKSHEADSQAFTPCVDGMADIYPCDKVDLLAFMSLTDIGGSNTNDIWGWTDPQDGKEYALVGRTNGSSFVDITDPENPVYLGRLPGHNGSTSSWRDIKVYADHAFIVSEAAGHGMQIFDLTRLRDVPNPPETFTEDAHYAGWGNAHNIVINEDSGYAYGVGTNTCSAGLDMVNISDPLNPVAAGCFSDDGYTHDAQCVNYMGSDADYPNSEICFNSNEDTLTIVDVTDKDNPVQLAREGYTGASYTHQGWLTEDHKYFLLGDELDETSNGHNTYTYIWDVQDLDAPELIGIHDSGIPSSDHNLYTKDNFVYQSNYSSGLRILDTSDIANGNIELKAYFDVFPAHNNAGFDGSWSNYPYFESGNIIVTSRTLGFMIVRANLDADFTLSSSPASQDVCVPDDAVYTVEVGSFEGFSEDVNLSLDGAPAGAGVDFSMNDMAPPFTSTLTLDTMNATAGSYEMTIVGMSQDNTHTSMVSLNLADMAPGDVTLTSPEDGATGVSRQPTFSWMAADQAAGYHLEVATDMDFTDVVFDVRVEETSYEAEMSLDVLTTYYWRVTAMNACDDGNTSAIWSFMTLDAPSILIVDDQNGDSDALSMWTDALDELDEEYDVFDTTINAGDPDAATMAPYKAVIHFTGYDWDASSGPDEEAAAAYLDMGTANAQKCLFISSQDYLWGQGGGGADTPTPFMMEYLGVSEGQSDVAQTTATGAGPFVELGPYTLNFPFPQNYSDRLEADQTASVAFVGSTGNSAVSKVTEGYRTTWWGFPWEAIPTLEDRIDAMAVVLDWCDESGTLDGTVTDADSGAPIHGAMVTAESGSNMVTAMTDQNGNYSMSVLPGSYDVMAEADNYVSDMAEGLDIMTDTMTTQDFMLAGSHLTYDPDMITGTMMIDEMVTNTVTLMNSGPLDIEFMLDVDAGMEMAPWATVMPDSGMIPAGMSVTVDVAFNSAGITETGTYSGSLMFDGTYVNDVADMPLVMHIDDGDGDGVDDEVECMVNDDCDGNGDGMADNMQINVTSLPNEGDDEGYVTIEAPADTLLVDVHAMAAPDTMPDGVESMPQGLFGFTVEGVDPGAEVTVTLYMENHATEMNGYWKHNEMTDMWENYIEHAEIMTETGTIILTLQDGGMGDSDGMPNGTIVDPGAPTVDTAQVTSVSLADFNSEANVLWQPVALLALLLLAVMAGGALMLRKRGLA